MNLDLSLKFHGQFGSIFDGIFGENFDGDVASANRRIFENMMIDSCFAIPDELVNVDR